MMRRILIQRGTLVLPDRKIFMDGDILIENGVITRIEKGIADPQACVIDASGLLVGPGFVNLHVHFREPGGEKKETLETGAKAAARGGFTTVLAMPNTSPPLDNPVVVRTLTLKARSIAFTNILFAGAISRGCQGKEMAEYGLLKEAGVVALSDDGASVESSRLLYLAFQYAQYFDLPFILHEEDQELSRDGHIHEGTIAFLLGYKGIPRVAEDSRIARDILLALNTGARVHFTHLSTEMSVALLRFFKNKVSLSADVTPHHLILTVEDIPKLGNLAKVKPPLREKKDIEALKMGIAEGVIDILASDHAPHAPEDKEGSFADAAFGIANLEVTVPLYVKALVEEGVIDWIELWRKLSYNPAKFLKLEDRGILAEGKVADITILDPQTEWEVDITQFESKGKNCPFQGWPLRGWPVYTIVGGRVVMAERRIVDGEFC
ncbi:MAG: dihydroorotase [Candidatus Caldatribacterium sp.]|nr:dihydroorotase [Candidatus Caldatribacterium sp.]